MAGHYRTLTGNEYDNFYLKKSICAKLSPGKIVIFGVCAKFCASIFK
jgi:hypothetical protein